jgi:hypothetical protein
MITLRRWSAIRNRAVIASGVGPLPDAAAPWSVRISLFLFMLSTIRFVNRDALGRDVGWQGFLQFGCVMLSALLCGGIMWRAKQIFKPDAYFLAMLGFSCFTLVSASRSYWTPLSVSKTVTFLGVIFAAAGSCARTGSRNVMKIMYIAVLATLCLGLILAAIGVYPLFDLDEYSGRTRFSVFVLHPGVVADLTAFAVLTGRLLPRKPPAWLQATLVILSILTSAKGATIGLLVGLVVSAAPWRKVTIGRLAGAAVCVCLALVLGMVVMNTMDDRVLSDGPLATLYGGNIKEEILTVNGRVELWKTVVPLLDSTVLLGFGLDGAREILLGAFDWSGNSHNAVLELILAAGMPGALLFVLGWGIAIWRATKLPPGWRSKVLAVHVYLIITSIASPIWTTSQYISVFYLTVINATSRESFTAPAWGRWSARMRLFWSNPERPRLWASPDAPPAG